MSDENNVFDENSDILKFTDEDGNIVEMELLDMFDCDEENYAFLVLTDEDADDLFIMRYEEDGDDASFEPVEDDDLYDRLYDMFRERHGDEFGFEE